MTNPTIYRKPLRWQLWPAALALALLATLIAWQTSRSEIVEGPAVQTTGITTAAAAMPTQSVKATQISTTTTAASTTPTFTPMQSTPVPAVTPTQTPQPTPTPESTVPPEFGATATPDTGESIVLTFDCGYSAASLSHILETLADHDTKATFFLEGHWVTRSPQIIPLLVAGGHEIGSHSYSHVNFTTLTEIEATSELTQTEQAIAQAGGPATLSLFRYPYGAHTTETDAWVSAQGYTPVSWSIDPMGWKSDTHIEDVVNHIHTYAEAGDIVLMHCGSIADEGALDQVITDLLGRGYNLVTVSEYLTSGR